MLPKSLSKELEEKARSCYLCAADYEMVKNKWPELPEISDEPPSAAAAAVKPEVHQQEHHGYWEGIRERFVY
jgi:hypothetical protein